jgi:uncharacterized protein (TIGR00730 family)
MNITVFGSSKPVAGDALYEEARQLGSLLANAGHTVVTGGYGGTMEGVSRGAAEAGGHVVGITTEEIEAWRPGGANHYVLEERSYSKLRARLYALIDACDAALALPGGIGTLTEISAMWSQLQVNANLTRPLILIGPGWKKVIDGLIDQFSEYIPEDDRPLLSYAETVENAVELLESKLSA